MSIPDLEVPVAGMSSLSQTWQEASAILRRTLSEDTYTRWIAGIVPLEITDRSLRLGVSNDVFSDWLNMNYRDLIEAALEEGSGRHLRISFESGHDPPPEPAGAASSIPVSPASASPAPPEPESKLPYNRRFTFGTFVVGEDNRFAHATCYAVAQTPGKVYNPLFIHSPVGLGKTHLLQAIAQEVKAKQPRTRVEYISSEEFANAYIDALRGNTLSAFRSHYRCVDVLLIDDVHFFVGKERFQEEFFHTFNALYNGHKQIVLTSDRPPHEIGGLEKRLVSRFEWGLTADILPPDLETRIAILKKKQDEHTVKLSDEVLFFVASRIRSNVRRLEGALVRLVSYSSLTKTEITEETAEHLLGNLFDQETASLITVEQIQRTVADYYDIRLADMSSKRRPQFIAFPRQVAMFFCRRLTDYSSPTIGEHFNRNHATILHAVRTVENRMGKDASFRREIAVLERKIKS